jgi:predicted ATPase
VLGCWSDGGKNVVNPANNNDAKVFAFEAEYRPMARLLGIRIKNYRSLADFRLGQVKYGKGDPLPRLVCLIGPNGSGKSTVLDAFGFVADCLLEGVEAACDKPARGGFDRLRTQGQPGPIEFEIFFEDDDPERPIVYELHVDIAKEVPAVVKETLRQRQEGETRGKPYYFLKLESGRGKVWVGQSVDVKAQSKDSQRVQLAELDKLGIATLGNLSEHPRIVRLRSYIEQWYLSYFVPDAARALPAAGAQRWLDRTGSNIGNVLQYYQRQYSRQFNAILKRLAKAIPGLKKITPEVSKDRRLLLRFDETGYQDPFYQQSMSDGTLKMLAYAVLLEDPEPRPFIGIEEPENGLYVRLVERLARQFSDRASKDTAATQILVTTHSPYFVDALQPEQVWLIRKNEKGQATAQRAADVTSISAMAEQGIPLGSLWYSNHFDDGTPE